MLPRSNKFFTKIIVVKSKKLKQYDTL